MLQKNKKGSVHLRLLPDQLSTITSHQLWNRTAVANPTSCCWPRPLLPKRNWDENFAGSTHICLSIDQMCRSNLCCVSWLRPRRSPDITVLPLANTAKILVVFEYQSFFRWGGDGENSGTGSRFYAVPWKLGGRQSLTQLLSFTKLISNEKGCGLDDLQNEKEVYSCQGVSCFLWLSNQMPPSFLL